MMGDPFLSTMGQVTTFDGNPTVSFTRWAEKFKDVLSLYTTRLSDEQKLIRLRLCLTGVARAEYDTMPTVEGAPRTLESVIQYLKGKFENGVTKSIARESLSI